MHAADFSQFPPTDKVDDQVSLDGAPNFGQQPGRRILVAWASLPAGAQVQLDAKIGRLERRRGGPVTVSLYRARSQGRILCRLTAGDGSTRILYMHGGATYNDGTPRPRGEEWWHRGY